MARFISWLRSFWTQPRPRPLTGKSTMHMDCRCSTTPLDNEIAERLKLMGGA